ncbi:MAG: hypothetical protein JOY64_22580 [Alphaproteobacteria bacterium]|nr:hypothetical protein [Alphaproteobacteria bacterium]MBV8410430.1 hypothetical protein [Alphaproteobacteria bacterium]
MVFSFGAWAGSVAAEPLLAEGESAKAAPAKPIVTIAPRIAAAWKKFDRATATFGVGRKDVVIGMHLVLEMH